jgi:hypothetical protein
LLDRGDNHPVDRKKTDDRPDDQQGIGDDRFDFSGLA